MKHKRSGRSEFLRANLNQEDGLFQFIHLRDRVDFPVYRGQTASLSLMTVSKT